MSVGGVCLVGVFSTRGEEVHNGNPHLHNNVTDAIINGSVGDAASSKSETANTPLGILVL